MSNEEEFRNNDGWDMILKQLKMELDKTFKIIPKSIGYYQLKEQITTVSIRDTDSMITS